MEWNGRECNGIKRGGVCRIKQTFELGIAAGEREDGEEKSGKLLRTYMDR